MALTYLADRSINHFNQFVKFTLLDDESLAKLKLTEKQIKALKTDQKPADEYVKERFLDVDGLLAEGLNEVQIETLRADLIERGLLPKVKAATATSEPVKAKKEKSKE